MAEEEKKFYWLKLRRDFFKRHDIRIIESMPNGKDYVLFYLKLMAESIDHEGMLRFSDTIPYDENMLSVITNTNVDIVRAAKGILEHLGLVEVLDEGTIFMREVEALTGSESKWAEKKRRQRLKEDAAPSLPLPSPDDVKHGEEPPAPPATPEAKVIYFGPTLQAAFEEWLKYKKERREAYKETGLRNLVGEIKNNAAKYGEDAVADLIRLCMASNWRGIIFDRLREQRAAGTGVTFAQMRGDRR